MKIQPDPDFERLRTTLYGGQADRVPLAEITIDEGAKEAFLGKPLHNLETDLRFFLEAGYDYLILGRRVCGFPPLWDAAGRHNYYRVQRQIAHGTSEGVISNWDDFRSYPWMKTSQLDFGIFDDAARILPESMKVIRYLSPIFQTTWMLMGFHRFSYALADDPGLIAAIMDKISDLVYYELEDALSRECVGAVWFGDDIAIKDRLMVPPAFLRKYFFPRLAHFGNLCRQKKIPLIYHTDGNVTEVVEDIISSGVVSLHPIDPTGMDIYRFKKNYAGRLSVIGNIDVSLLISGTPEEVIRDTTEHLARLAPGGGYIAGSSNSIPRNSKPESYRAFLETVRSYRM